MDYFKPIVDNLTPQQKEIITLPNYHEIKKSKDKINNLMIQINNLK